MNPQILQMLLQRMQGGQPQGGMSPAGGMMGSLPFPRPGMGGPGMGMSDPSQMNSSILSALGGGGAPGGMAPGGMPQMPQMGGFGGIPRMPVMPRSGGVSPVASLVRNHFSQQPRQPMSSLNQNMRSSLGGRY